MSKAELSREGQEWRRIRAWDLWQQGWQQKEIAKGAKPHLCASDRAKLPALLAWRAEAFGFSGNVWNSRRVSKVIKQVFGVSYHPDHCGRLLREMGWSQQKPLERAAQRNEEAIQDWREQQWPALKKKPSKRSGPSSL